MPPRSRLVRKLSVVAIALTGGGWIAGSAAISATGSRTDESTTNQIVLGSPNYAGKYGRGWGDVKPKRIDNGGVPSGVVVKIHWRRWGSAVALGRGQTYIYKPRGGYYKKRGAIKLRASRRGTCPGTNGQRAYTRLRARVVKRPGGKFGRWFSWAGTKDICSFNS